MRLAMTHFFLSPSAVISEVGMGARCYCVHLLCCCGVWAYIRRSRCIPSLRQARIYPGPLRDVQNQDLRRVDQAIVQVRDQEGNLVAQAVTNQAGEFAVTVPKSGTYSISAVRDTLRSEYVVVKIGARAAGACVAYPCGDERDCVRDRVAASARFNTRPRAKHIS